MASRKSMNALKARVVANNTKLASTMFSGFLEALCTTYNTEELLFSTNMARINPALFNFGGHATLYPVLRYKATKQAGMLQAARNIGESLMAAMQHSPSPSLYKASAHDREMIAAGASWLTVCLWWSGWRDPPSIPASSNGRTCRQLSMPQEVPKA